MQETIWIAQTLGTAFLTSPFGAGELMLGVLVGAGLLTFLVRGPERRPAEEWNDKALSRRC